LHHVSTLSDRKDRSARLAVPLIHSGQIGIYDFIESI
jgi:hypothetical protein